VRISIPATVERLLEQHPMSGRRPLPVKTNQGQKPVPFNVSKGGHTRAKTTSSFALARAPPISIHASLVVDKAHSRPTTD